MRRRLMILAMAIATVVALAFLVPLGLSVRNDQRDRAMVAASQQASEVASFASLVGDSGRMQSALVNLDYRSSSNDIVVWFADGRAARANQPTRPSGPMPESVSAMFGTGSGVLPSASALAPGAATGERAIERAVPGGVEILWPVSSSATPTVVRVFVPSAVLTRGVFARLVWLGAVALALVLAAGVIAGRSAGLIMGGRRGEPVSPALG